jgi:adenosylcobinamide-GDP ribazoletransferase
MTGSDSSTQTEEQGRVSPVSAFLAALQFLTITPPIIRRPFTAAELGSGAGFYPLVGLLIGGVLFAADHFLTLILPAQVCAALTLALWIILSGALHLDGFLDACDGLLGGSTPESRLQIMRDERVGAYALAGGILLLLIKFTLLNALSNHLEALLIAPVLGRWSMAFTLYAYPYARPQGLGREIKDHTTWREINLATLTALPVAWFAGSWLGLIAFGVSFVLSWGLARFTLRRIPGLTGDIYGAVNELIEVIVLLVLLVGTRL